MPDVSEAEDKNERDYERHETPFVILIHGSGSSEVH
jgi:hypothetical protein